MSDYLYLSWFLDIFVYSEFKMNPKRLKISKMTIEDLIRVLPIATGPVILVSGIGLLLLTMTNRLGRVIDRARSLCSEITGSSGDETKGKELQLDILWKRAQIIRMSIAFASSSALIAALFVVVLFIVTLYKIEISWLLSLLFILCLGSLIISLLLLIRDINKTLSALKLEIKATNKTDNKR